MTWTVLVAGPARKLLNRSPAEHQARLFRAIEEPAVNPSADDSLKLKAEANSFRRRIGPWRIIFTLHPKQRTVEVAAIVRPSEARLGSLVKDGDP